MPQKTEDRIVSVYTFLPSSKEIRRKRVLGDQLIDEVVAANYDPDKKIVTFATARAVKDYKEAVITFLGENEMTVMSFQRADLDPDKPLNDKSVPPRPKKKNAEGDKTLAVIDWYFKFRPNEFKTRYGYLGTYSGFVRFKQPTWEPRPMDNKPEYRGEVWVEDEVTNVMVTLRKTPMSFLPEECVGNEDPEKGALSDPWSDDEPEAREAEESLPNMRAGGRRAKGGEAE